MATNAHSKPNSPSSSATVMPKVRITSFGLPLYHRSQIPAVYKEPFIIDGYRKPNSTVMESLKYLFVMHNDVGNFWTHLVPLCIWLPWLYRLSLQVDLTDPYFYPLLCFWAGACSYTILSSIAHTFSTVSFTVRTVCFMLDYMGIAMYAFGASLAIFFYEQPLHGVWFERKWLILPVQMVLAINAVLLCSLSRFFWKNQRFVIRAFAFVLPYVILITPFIQRMQVCLTTGNECVMETIYLHHVSFVITFIVAFFFVTKIPERFAPGRFDFIGQSHQLFHVAATLLTSMQMYMFPLDAILRRDELAQVKGASPGIYTTFVPYIVVQVSGLFIVAVFGYLVVKRVLISNKKEVVKDIVESERKML